MKKVVRLTESDLVRLVKQVISEQSTKMSLEVTPFLKDNGFTATQGTRGGSYEKKFTENHILVRFPFIDKVEVCVTKITKCDTLAKAYMRNNWNFKEFKKNLNQYMI